jgi:hypothetical protein
MSGSVARRMSGSPEWLGSAARPLYSPGSPRMLGSVARCACRPGSLELSGNVARFEYSLGGPGKWGTAVRYM